MVCWKIKDQQQKKVCIFGSRSNFSDNFGFCWKLDGERERERETLEEMANVPQDAIKLLQALMDQGQ